MIAEGQKREDKFECSHESAICSVDLEYNIAY